MSILYVLLTNINLRSTTVLLDISFGFEGQVSWGKSRLRYGFKMLVYLENISWSTREIYCLLCACDAIVSHSSYRNCPILVMEIFLGGTCYPKICYLNIILLQKFFSIEILLFSRWPMVVPSSITKTVYLMLTSVGSLEHVNSSPTAPAHLSLYAMIAMHAAKYSVPLL